MFDEITEKKKECIKRKIHNSIFSVLIFENIITLLSRGLMFEIVGFLRDITEEDKNNDRIYY